MAKKEPLQTARFGHEAVGRERVSVIVEKHLPEDLRDIAPEAVRFVVIINENGEIQSLDDLIDCPQVTWGQLNEAMWKRDEMLLPATWYCVRLLRINQTQIVHHLTFSSSSKKTVQELKASLEAHFQDCFPDEKDKDYQRESRNLT